MAWALGIQVNLYMHVFYKCDLLYVFITFQASMAVCMEVST